MMRRTKHHTVPLLRKRINSGNSNDVILNTKFHQNVVHSLVVNPTKLDSIGDSVEKNNFLLHLGLQKASKNQKKSE